MIEEQSSSPKAYLSARSDGGAIVEFALIVALLITLLAGIFEFGRAFWYYEALTKATRDGARMMSTSAKASIASQGVPAARQLVADAAAGAGITDFDAANVEVTCLDVNLLNAACTDGTAPGGIRVQIIGYTMPIGQLIPFLIGQGTAYTATLAPHTTMRYML